MVGTVVFASLALLTPHGTPEPIDQGLQAVIALADPGNRVQLPPLSAEEGGAQAAPVKSATPLSKTLKSPNDSVISSIVMKMSLPLLILAGLLAAVALFRRKSIIPRSIKVLESVTLGKNRNLVIADVAGRRMLIGSSEAGITLISDDIPMDEPLDDFSQTNANSLTDDFPPVPTAASGLLNRLKGKKRAPVESFDSHLPRQAPPSFDESAELRAKLAARLGGKAA